MRKKKGRAEPVPPVAAWLKGLRAGAGALSKTRWIQNIHWNRILGHLKETHENIQAH